MALMTAQRRFARIAGEETTAIFTTRVIQAERVGTACSGHSA